MADGVFIKNLQSFCPDLLTKPFLEGLLSRKRKTRCICVVHGSHARQPIYIYKQFGINNHLKYDSVIKTVLLLFSK